MFDKLELQKDYRWLKLMLGAITFYLAWTFLFNWNPLSVLFAPQVEDGRLSVGAADVIVMVLNFVISIGAVVWSYSAKIWDGAADWVDGMKVQSIQEPISAKRLLDELTKEEIPPQVMEGLRAAATLALMEGDSETYTKVWQKINKSELCEEV
jgi:hypothetical protein